jgi:PPOX class probable F420-dependent enzyme
MATTSAELRRTTTTTATFAPFARQRTVLLTTYRRDGTPVGTPVSIAVAGDRAFFRTYDKAWKSKRLRRNPDATIAPSTVRGTPTGPAIHARARLLNGAEATAAARALARKYPLLHGFLVPLAHRLARYTTLHYELTV